MIQQCMNAAERTRALPAVLVIADPGAAFIQALIGNFVVARKSTEDAKSVHIELISRRVVAPQEI